MKQLISYANFNGINFRLTGDSVAGAIATEHMQSFDIAPDDHKQIDIIFLDETVENNSADILYAIPRTRITIPQHFFPHVLVVRATSNELAKPVDSTFTVYIDRNGILKMIEGKIGP